MAHRAAAKRRTTRSKHRERRSRAPSTHGGNGWDIQMAVASDQLVGPNVRSATLEEVLESVSALDGDLEWPGVASRVLPLFERMRPYPPGFADHPTTVVASGIPIGLAIDLDAGFVHISSSMIEGWRMSIGDVAAQAMANLHARAAGVGPDQIFWGEVDRVQTGWLQTGRSIGSTLVLAPTELGRIFGSEPRLLVAPMRDLLIAFPPEEVELAGWLFAEIASEDPNHLHPRLFRFDGSTISVHPMADGRLLPVQR